MSAETLAVSATVAATPEAVFAVLADPSTHAAIDGTGWVRDSHDGVPVTAADQVFGMDMYHPNHPDGDYKMANLVTVYDRPRAIGWKPGQYDDKGNLGFGEWTWRYDLTPTDGGTEVTLTYDWSAVPPQIREYIQFPPFSPDHLHNSLANLGALATKG